MKPTIQSVPITEITPGQSFMYRGQRYRRATEEQALTHSAKSLQDKLGLDDIETVLVYALGYRNGQESKIPSSFVTVTPEGEATMVYVTGGKV